MGAEGAPLLAAAMTLNDSDLHKLEANARIAAFLQSDAYKETMASEMATMSEVMAQGGMEALQAYTAAQVSGVPGAVQAVIDKYNLTLTGFPATVKTDADLTGAQDTLATFIQQKREAGVDVTALTGDAQQALDTLTNMPRHADVNATALTGDAEKAFDTLMTMPRVAVIPAQADNIGPTDRALNNLAETKRTANIAANSTNVAPTDRALNDIGNKSRKADIAANATNVDATDRALNNIANKTRVATITVRESSTVGHTGKGDSGSGGGGGGGGGLATGGYVRGAGTGHLGLDPSAPVQR
jgi:hypothetical protein